jgi:hypothetical protein
MINNELKWLEDYELLEDLSLEIVTKEGNSLFKSKGKWLYPLLEVEQFLQKEKLDSKQLVLVDRVAGKAAAALAIRLGFKNVKIYLMSCLAEDLYKKYGVSYIAKERVDAIGCRTEHWLLEEDDLEKIYAFVLERAQLSKQKA